MNRNTSDVSIASLQEIIAYTESIVDTVREPFLVLDAELQVVTASRSFYRVFAVAAEQTIGRFVYDLGTANGTFRSFGNCWKKSCLSRKHSMTSRYLTIFLPSGTG